MQDLIKPLQLQTGDKVVAISHSWGGAGDFPHKYHQGRQQLQDAFGLVIVESRHALKPSSWVYRNPQARADDLMEAFSDPSVKAIFSNVGGEDAIRVLPFIDCAVIRSNPKIFLGFSDSTVIHFACSKAGLGSFYGPAVMQDFAENGGIRPYQAANIRKLLFSSSPYGRIAPNTEGWTSEKINWSDTDSTVQRTLQPADGWDFLQGRGKVEGRLIGGCLEVMEMLKGTSFWPEKHDWQDTILFWETSELTIHPKIFRWIIRGYVAQGILSRIKGILLGRPVGNQFRQEYNDILLQIIRDELQMPDLPVVTGMDFGHTSPAFTLPIGRMAVIDCEQKIVSITESAVRAVSPGAVL